MKGNNRVGLWLAGSVASAGLSQAEVARRAGISITQMSRIIQGHSLPSDKTLLSMATVLNVEEEAIFKAADRLPPAKGIDEAAFAERLNGLLEELPPAERIHVRTHLEDTARMIVRRSFQSGVA